MQTEVLDLRVLNKRQLTDFDVGCETVAPEHFRHRFRVVSQLAPPRYLVLTLLFTLMAQNPGGDKEGNDAHQGRDDGGKNKGRPDLVCAPLDIFVLQYLLRVVLQLMAVITDGIDRLGFENIAHGGQRLTPVINHAVHERLPGQFDRQRNRDNDAEENDETVHDDIGDLAEHTDAHARDLTALGHILCIKTHDVWVRYKWNLHGYDKATFRNGYLLPRQIRNHLRKKNIHSSINRTKNGTENKAFG